jgi:predicted ester cyclase
MEGIEMNETTTARDFVDRLMDLWSEPIVDPVDAYARFAGHYHDPVTINGTELRLTALVTRAADLHESLHRNGVDILDVVQSEDVIAVAFRMRGTQIGSYRSALGDVPTTGRNFALQVIDILHLRDGRIESIWMVADESGLLAQLRG